MAERSGIFGRRREQREADMQAAIDKGIADALEKAMSPAVAQAGMMSSGATYPVFQRSQDSPFNQVGPGQGFQPLPRPPGMFDSGFGPANPLFPDAIDPLLPNGRTMARRTEYLIAANVNLIDRRVPWSVLQGLAEDVDVIQRCIQIVQDAIIGLDWSWGFSPQIIQQIMTEEGLTNSSKAASIARDKYGDELARVQAFFDYPDKRMGFTFSQWLTDIIYSHLVYDGIVVAPEYTLGGELSSLSTIDTSTIKILLDNQGFIPRPPAPAYQQILYGFPRGEFQAENVSQDGKVPDAFTSDQLAYYIRRPRPNNIYGYSQVEECINIATIYMERQAWLHAEYTNGVTPRMVITTEGTESWSPEQLAYYERIYNDQFSGQTARRQNFMLMRPGMKAEQLKNIDEAYKSTYDEWLVMQIAAKFGVPMNLMGIKGPSTLGGGKDKGQSDQYEQYATDALKNFLIECINDMARRFLGVGSELTMTASGGGNDADDLARAQADQIDINAGIRTRNEIRAERGIPLMSEPEADQLGVTVGTGVTFLAGTLAAQQAQQSAGAAGAGNGTAGATQSTGTSGNAGAPDESAGSGTTDGTTDADDSANASGASAGSSESESKPSVTAKDDERQPDIEKELSSFERFAKARIARDSWRDFEFEHVSTYKAARLNGFGRQGDFVAIRHELAKADDGNAQALIDWYNAGADGQIDWGSEGDFDACVAIAGKYIDNAEGFCNLRHQDAVGGAPGSEDTKKAEFDDVIGDREGEPADQDLYDKVIAAAKRKFDVYPSAYANGWVVQEYRRRGGSYRKPATKAASDSDKFTPPQGVREEAQRAVEWIKDGHAGANFTAVGNGRAHDLAAGKPQSLDIIKRMSSYLARHEVDKQGKGWSPGDDGYPSPGRVAWAAWGGDPAVSWTNGILASAEKSALVTNTGEAIIAPTGQLVMPTPLQAGDKIIVEHADKSSDSFPVIDLSEPSDTTPEQENGEDVEVQIQEIDATTAKALVEEMLEPHLDMLRERYSLLERLRNRK